MKVGNFRPNSYAHCGRRAQVHTPKIGLPRPPVHWPTPQLIISFLILLSHLEFFKITSWRILCSTREVFLMYAFLKRMTRKMWLDEVARKEMAKSSPPLAPSSSPLWEQQFIILRSPTKLAKSSIYVVNEFTDFNLFCVSDGIL